MTKTQAVERIVVPVVRAEATGNWLFLLHKKSNQWFIPADNIGKKPAILVATELLIKHIGDIDNIQEFYVIKSNGKFIQLFVSGFEFEKSFALHKTLSDQMWANPLDILNMPKKDVYDFTRTILEITLETAKKMHNK